MRIMLKCWCFFLCSVVLFSVCFAQTSIAQTNWTLEDCLNYATENHLSIQLKQLDIQNAATQNKQASFNALPSVNGGVTHGYNWGQSIDPFTNQFASNRVQTNNLYFSSSWSIFKGFQNYHLQKKTNSELQYQHYNLEVERRNLKIDITAAYLQVVLNHSIWQIKTEQFGYSLNQKQRIQALVDSEYLTTNDLLETVAQTAMDSAQMVKSKNEYIVSLLQLKQLLNLELKEEFSIQLSNFIESNSGVKTELDYVNLPELKALELKQQMSELELKIAQGRLSPSLSINASMGSGYSGNNQEFVGNQLQPKPFPTQLEENFYQTAALSLSIPLFNNWLNGAEIQRSKIEIERTRIEKTQLIQSLAYKIEQLQIELINIKGTIEAMKMALSSAEAAFESATLKYENGYIKLTEFLEIKNKLFATQRELTQLNVELLFKEMVLRVYFV